jgi:thioredoxin-like negative regulator of GroEL
VDDRLAFIQTQLWWLMAILIAFVATNIVCMLVNRRRTGGRSAPPFEQMWEMGKIPELEAAATSYLRKYPNNINARLFLAKSLTSREQYQEALPHMKHLLKIEPTWNKMMQEMIAEVTKRASGS